MKAIFIAGTDTGVGKTLVTGLLARQLSASGQKVVTQKWVQTGRKSFSDDIGIHLKLMGRKRGDYAGYLSSMAPYTFRFSASPHLASRLEKQHIRIDRIKKSLENLVKHFNFVIIEGTGGLLAPLNRRMLSIDLVKELRLPVLLVAANKLGSINHTLLAIEALKRRDMKIAGMIFNNISVDTDDRILEDNPRIVKKFSGVKILGILPYISGL